MTEQPLTLARLDRMRGKARNAPQAELLLSHLAIFREPFGRSTVAGMAPEGMNKATYIAAFATLRFRNIVKQVSSKRFYVEEPIRDLFPPTDALRLQQLNFFISCVSVYDGKWTRRREVDLSSALRWGFIHQPALGFKFTQKLRNSMAFHFWKAERVHMEIIYQQALEDGDLTLQNHALQALEQIPRL